MGHRRRTFARIALVLPTEYAYARAVLRGIIAATRERNLYAAGQAPSHGEGRNGEAGGEPGGKAGGTPGNVQALPWLFNVFRGIYGHSSKYLARWFADWNPDGVICQIYDDRLANVYRQTRKPVVELFESRPASEFPRILPDDVATGQLAARHFLERGFRHFAFFGAPWMLWSGERETGFKREIERTFYGRSDARPYTYHSHGAARSTRDTTTTAAAPVLVTSQKERSDAMGTWLAALPKPVAVFAANDLWGSELVQAARQRSLHVPADVAILGVDNEELLCEIAHPPLSSIRIGAEQIGRAAVSVLEELMSGRKRRRRQQIPRIPPMEVVTRQSTDVLAVEDEDVATAIQHIRRHAVEGISVKQLLEIVPVNRRTLERRFMAVLGHTPLDEIRRVRLDRAKVLLQTDLPVYEVAQRSGFATPEYLATSFLQATGMTPTEYRRQFGPRSRWEHLPPSVAD